MLKLKQIAINTYFISLILYFFCNHLLSEVIYGLEVINKIILVILVLSFICILLLQKHSKKAIILESIFTLIVLFTYWKSGMTQESILIAFSSILVVREYDIKKITKLMFYVSLSLYLLLLFLTIINIIPHTFTIKSNSLGLEYNMLVIGMKHGNTQFMMISAIIGLFIYSYIDKYNWIKAVIVQAIVTMMYLLFYSRTGLVTCSLVIWISLYLKNKQDIIKQETPIYKILKIPIENCCLILYAGVYIASTVLYGTQFVEVLNAIIPSRILSAHLYIEQCGVGLFPQEVFYHSVFDNAQMYVMVTFGLIFTSLIIAIYYMSIRKYLKNSKYIEVLLLIIFLLYSYSEKAFIIPFPNFTILFLINAFLPNRKEVNQNEK